MRWSKPRIMAAGALLPPFHKFYWMGLRVAVEWPKFRQGHL
jgi:hypothetical protein